MGNWHPGATTTDDPSSNDPRKVQFDQEKDVYEFESSGSYNASNDPINGSDQSPITIQRELRVPAGVSITLNNVEIHFAPGARLVIENGDPASNLLGGRLTLKNSILTSSQHCLRKPRSSDESSQRLNIEY